MGFLLKFKYETFSACLSADICTGASLRSKHLVSQCSFNFSDAHTSEQLDDVVEYGRKFFSDN